MNEEAMKKLDAMIDHYGDLSDCMIEGQEMLDDLLELKAKVG